MVNRPDSKDTAQGIIEWWILQQELEVRVQHVKDALIELVRNGYILENRTQNSNALYFLNKGRITEIERVLDLDSNRIE